LDYDDLLARDRELQLEKIRARHADRAAMRRVYRKRRAFAVALLAFPIAAFALATSWPSSKQPSKPAAQVSSTSTAPTTTADTTPARFPEPKQVRAVHVGIDEAAGQAKLDQIVAAADPVNGVNAVELDVRDEWGHIGFGEGMPALALSTGAAKDRYEPRLVVQQLHNAGLYVIGRVVTFQDTVVAPQRPNRAIRTPEGGVWQTAGGKAWLNPYDTRNWDYAIDVARAAGRLGFDEIQFDYVRFPTDGPPNQVYAHRRPGPLSTTITAFLKRAVRDLHQDHLRVSADIFGLAAQSDQGIGQDPAKLRDVLDAISPMIYPQGYAPDSYGIAKPQEEPYRLISKTLEEWQLVLAPGTAELRPWLQAYTLFGPHYGTAQVKAQVRALDDSGPNGGFLLWNPTAEYEPGMLTFSAK
jgi:hypothetical protein